MKDEKYWIKKLNLLPHPEGGYYKESYRSEELILSGDLPERYTGDRNFSTSIYYLLCNKQVSKLHRIKSDEMWHFYDGSGLEIYEFDNNGKVSIHKLGLDSERGELPQILIRAGKWFGVKVNKPDSFCLAGCTVSPGFNFADFEFADAEKLIQEFPDFKKIIKELT